MNSDQILKLAQAARAQRLSGEARRRIELGLGVGNVHIDRALTNLAVMYRNREFIADLAMPVVTVAKKSDKFFKFKPETMFNVAAVDMVGAESKPGRPAIALDTPGTYSCIDRGLTDFISTDEEINADAPLSPRMDVTEILTNYLLLARELRVATVVFNSANYGANHQALSGTAQWDQSTSDPVANIDSALRAPLVRPNTMVIGEEAYDALRSNPKLLQYVLSRAGTRSGPVPMRPDEQMIASWWARRSTTPPRRARPRPTRACGARAARSSASRTAPRRAAPRRSGTPSASARWRPARSTTGCRAARAARTSRSRTPTMTRSSAGPTSVTSTPPSSRESTRPSTAVRVSRAGGRCAPGSVS
jgi:hypothetical protein